MPSIVGRWDPVKTNVGSNKYCPLRLRMGISRVSQTPTISFRTDSGPEAANCARSASRASVLPRPGRYGCKRSQFRRYRGVRAPQSRPRKSRRRRPSSTLPASCAGPRGQARLPGVKTQRASGSILPTALRPSRSFGPPAALFLCRPAFNQGPKSNSRAETPDVRRTNELEQVLARPARNASETEAPRQRRQSSTV
jgi:hypothetical protein